MKEFIKNNYNIEINKIYKDYFYFQNEKIKIITYNKNDNVHKYLNVIKDKRISEFVLNKNNEIISKYMDKNIILLKINDLNSEIDLDYLNIFNTDNEILNEKDILNHWEKEIDDIEIKLKDKYKDYYIGLSEIAISILKNNNDNVIKCIGHDIPLNKYCKEELNNPLNFIRVDKLYNISNYVKYKFFYKKINMNEFENIVEQIKKEKKLKRFLGYMLYTNYFFETEEKENLKK